MIVFDKVFDLLPPPGIGLGVNTEAYLRFAEWAKSSETRYNDCHEKNNGYRNDTNIYQIP